MFPDFQSNEFMELSQLDFLEYFPFKVSASWLNWHMLFFTEYSLKDGSYWPFYFLSVDIYSYCQFDMSIVNNKADRQWRPSTLLLTHLLMRRTPLLGIWFSEGSYRQWIYSFSTKIYLRQAGPLLTRGSFLPSMKNWQEVPIDKWHWENVCTKSVEMCTDTFPREIRKKKRNVSC